MHLRNTSLLVFGALGALVLSACGPAGTITGKVNVEGGSAAGIAVIAYGPQSGATVTKDDGSFTVERLPDGAYVVRATLRGAEVEEVSTTATITQGKSNEAVLNFKLSTSKITGRVSFTDGSNPQGLTVNAVGPVTAGARTEANGSFTFDGLKTGAYLVSVEAPDTKEGRVAIGVFASGAVDAGELKLTPIGRLGGTVQYNAMPASGVAVTVPGTSIASVTDEMGRFVLDGIPAGAQTVLARTGAAPFFRSATAMTTIARGSNPDVMIMLTDEMPPTGQVTGIITFHGARSPRDITVSAPGSGVTATPAVNGAYALSLPEGVWDIVANASSHPQLTLGRVQVTAGRIVNLPGRELSWWKPIWTSSTPITGAVTQFSTTAPDAAHSWSLVALNDGLQRRVGLVNSTTFEFRLVAVGNTSFGRVSRLAKYAGWSVNNTAFVYEIATGVLSTFTAQQTITDLQFSSDESTLFLTRTGPTLTRIAFANPTMPRVFPMTGNASAIFMQNVDRWFVQRATDIDLVQVSNEVSNVFVSVAQFSVNPTAWALTNCAAACELRVLGPAATQNLRDTAVSPVLGTVSAFTSSTLQSRADFPCFTQGGTSSYCYDTASSGNHVALAGVPSQFRLNEMGNRVIWVFTSGTNIVREEAFPPQPTTMNLTSSANSWGVGWLSPNRAFAVERTGMTRSVHLITNGTDAPDTDVGTQGVVEAPPLLVIPQASTSRWRAVLGNNMARTIDVATSIPVSSLGVRPLGTGPNAVTRYAGISFDQTLTYVVEEQMATVRVVPGGFVSGATRAGAVELAGWVHTGAAQQEFLFYNNNAIISAADDVTLYTTVGTPPTLSALGLSPDMLTIYGGQFSL